MSRHAATKTKTKTTSDTHFARPVLKTLNYRGQRTSLRLEKAFWDALSYIARLRSDSVRHYISDVLEDSRQADSRNRSAYLRAQVVSDLIAEADQDRLDLADLKSLVRAASTPVFVLDHRGKLVDFNDEMAQFIRMSFSNNKPDNPKASLELVFARPLAAIQDELQRSNGAPALLNFSLSYGGVMVPGKVKLTAVGPKNTVLRRLVGYVLPQ